jgi:signal transduction histidine kinase
MVAIRCDLVKKVQTTSTFDDEFFVISSLPPSRFQVRLASGVVICILAVAVLVMWPLSGERLRPIAAILPMYLMAMFLCDSITAALLFSQFAISRSLANLVIASGYLFTAITIIPYSLTFPGVFSPEPLIGRLQSTAWLFDLWHVGFPLFVIAYGVLKDEGFGKRLWRGTVRVAIAFSFASIIVVVSTVVFLSIVSEESSPVIILDTRRFSSLFPYYVGMPVVLASLAAIIVLWVRRRSLLDLWLMVVLFLYVVEMPISIYPDPERFSLGWTAARVLGIFDSSIVLIVLLYEITYLYVDLRRAVRGQRREREARLMTGDAVAAAIAHEVRQPLTAIVNRANVVCRWLQRPEPDLEKAKAALRNIAADGHRAATMIHGIRGNFRKEVQARTAIDIDGLIQDTVELLRGDLQSHEIHLKVAGSAKVRQIFVDRIQLQEVLLNLIRNAIDAMASVQGPRVLSVQVDDRAEIGIVVSVADNGIGISQENIEKIFDPLFTTKAGGKGLGLSICRLIVQAHDGDIWVRPNKPRGVIFEFAVPMPAKAVSASA